MDERIVRDSERGKILTLYETSTAHIESLRNSRRRMSIYEHLEWLHGRWEKSPPGRLQRTCERVRGKPFEGKRERVR